VSSSSTKELECAAVIVGGGTGSRFGGDKLAVTIDGRPVLAWTLKAFEETPLISSIVVVAPVGREEEFRDIAREAGISKLIAVVTGGSHRKESVLNGLRALPESSVLVAIHDAARPLVTPHLITGCLETANAAGAASAAVPVSDTLHHADQEGCASKTIDRSGLWAMQTPQVFRAAPLMQLLEEQHLGNPTDEVSVALAAGWRIPFVENREPNIKITWPSDLAVAESLLRSRKTAS
jgi:2-C-methyl-D-erythritol 4-phosphate cytidylyltransferase